MLFLEKKRGTASPDEAALVISLEDGLVATTGTVVFE